MHQESLKGASKLGRVVGATLGPGGRTIAIDPYQKSNFNQFSVYPKPVVTKDGVTVARHLNLLKTPLENVGGRLLIDAAE